MENLLLLFTEELPCWNHEAVSVAGEAPEGLDPLAESGDLARLGAGYVLTPQGLITRERVANELYLPLTPAGRILTDESEADELLVLNVMVQYMDRAFMTDWGIKEVAVWPSHELVRRFLEAFPNWGVSARKFPATGPVALDLGAEKNGLRYGSLCVDFVLRARADFNHYKDYPQLESDKVRGEPEGLLPFIGRLHIFLTEQRRIFLPVWFDIDHDQNEDWTLLAFVTDTEPELESLTKTLRSWGHELIDPVNPLYILGMNIERLRSQREQKRTIYDWVQEEAVRIIRPDAPDGE